MENPAVETKLQDEIEEYKKAIKNLDSYKNEAEK